MQWLFHIRYAYTAWIILFSSGIQTLWFKFLLNTGPLANRNSIIDVDMDSQISKALTQRLIFLYGLMYNSFYNCFPRGLAVRISGFHPGGPGSIPGVGNPFYWWMNF